MQNCTKSLSKKQIKVNSIAFFSTVSSKHTSKKADRSEQHIMHFKNETEKKTIGMLCHALTDQNNWLKGYLREQRKLQMGDWCIFCSSEIPLKLIILARFRLSILDWRIRFFSIEM